MQLKSNFLLAIQLFIVISSSLVFDHSRAEEYEANNNVREFTNPPRRTSKVV